MALSKQANEFLSSCQSIVQGYLGNSFSRPTPLILTGTAGFLATWLLWRSFRNRHRKPPPSPPGWPLIGNALEVEETTFAKDLVKVQNKYNLPDIFSLKLGPGNRMVFLNSYDAIKDAMVTQGELFAARPFFALSELLNLQDELFFKDYQDPTWSEGKAFIISTLRSMGFGSTKNSEEKILDQVERLTRNLDNNCKEPFNIGDILPQATANVILEILFNKTYDFGDPQLLKWIELIKKQNAAVSGYFYLELLPLWLAKRVVPSKMLQISKRLVGAIQAEIEEHVQTIDPEEPRDFIDIYLSKKKGPIDHTVLRNTTFVLLPDAVETIAVFISWTILYVTHNKDVMARMQKELDAVSGANRHVKWSDRPNLPFVEAVIMESVRISCPIIATGPHTPIHDCHYRGYFIPKGMTVIGNLYAAMTDPKVFQHPEKFNPSRFMGEDGRLKKEETWIPFGMGRRKCVGEQTAKIEAFLYVSNLLQRYNFSFPEGEPVPTLDPDPKNNIVKSPQPYKVVLTQRK